MPALAVIICLSCGGERNNQGGVNPLDLHLPDQVLTNTETYLTSAGRRTGVIKAETLKVYTNKDTTLMYGVHVTFYDSSGAHVSTLTADSGLVTRNSTILEAEGNVRAWTVGDKLLLTDSLRWDATREEITTEGFVKAIRGADTISGWGLQTDQRLENIVIKNIQGSFREPDSETD